MVELRRSFFPERLPRSPTAAGLVSVPALPRVPDESARILQAGGALAEGLAQSGKAVAAVIQRDNQLKYAQETAQAAQQIGNFHLGVPAIQQRMVEENVPYLERSEYLKQYGQELRDELLANVPKRLQTAASAEMTTALARLMSQQTSLASAQFVDEHKQTFPNLVDMLSRQLVAADPRQFPAIEQSISAIGTAYVQAGILSQGLVNTYIQQAHDRAMTQRTQAAILAQPQAMDEHLTRLAAGQAGLPGLPVPPPQDLYALAQQARSQVRQDVEAFERNEQRAAADLSKVQDQHAINLENRLLETNLTLDEARQVGADARKLGEQGLLKPGPHGQILREARTMEKALLEGPAVTDAAIKRRMLIELHGEHGGASLDVLRTQVVQWLEDRQISVKDAQDWLGEITRQREANYYTHDPLYKEARQFLDQSVNYLNNISFSSSANRQEVEEVQSRVANALEAYSARMREIWTREGPPGVKAQAMVEARAVQERFGVTPREVLNYFPEPPVLQAVPRTGTLEERYTAAKQALAASTLTDSEKADQYRLLRERQILETQVEKSEAAEARLKQQQEQKARQQSGTAGTPSPTGPIQGPPPPPVYQQRPSRSRFPLP